MARAIIVFLGPPGAGKGTQAKKLSAAQGICHISTGEMLRAAVASDSALGQRVKTTLDAGQLVSDELMIQLVQARFKEADCAKGAILDGFPRTVPQAEALSTMLSAGNEKLSAVVLFELSDDEVRARLAHRSGQEARSDDTGEVQLERMRVYRDQTAPLIGYYDAASALTRVSAAGTVDEVYAALTKALAL